MTGSQKDFIVRVENSAPSQTKPARAVTWSSQLLQSLGVERVADFGCGRLRNLPVLEAFFNHITLVDTRFQCARIKSLVPKRRSVRLLEFEEFIEDREMVDAIFSISVLHVVPEVGDRRRMIRLAYEKLEDGGYYVVDVPTSETYYARRCKEENKFKDGWIMGKGKIRTFYKNFNAQELDKFVEESAGFEIFSKNNQIKHISRIFRKVK